MINNKVSFTTDEGLNQTMNELDEKKVKQYMDL